jgi:HAD superfamily phosphoserine phosphatase-like hydrolase
MQKPIKFIFDLDGTVTTEETLPFIAKHFHIQAEIDNLTKETRHGNIPFVESFIKRVQILGRLPVSEVSSLLGKVNLYPQLHAFIQENRARCIIATGNLSCWVDALVANIGCPAACSEAVVEHNRVVKLARILRKELLVEECRRDGYAVVYTGDGNDDLEAMRTADIAIAVGMTHAPSKSLLPVSDYVIFNEKALCRQLNQLL